MLMISGPDLLRGDKQSIILFLLVFSGLVIIWIENIKHTVVIYLDGISRPLSTWAVVFGKKPQKILLSEIIDWNIGTPTNLRVAWCDIYLENKKIVYNSTNIGPKFFMILVRYLKQNSDNVNIPERVKRVGGGKRFFKIPNTISIEKLEKWIIIRKR